MQSFRAFAPQISNAWLTLLAVMCAPACSVYDPEQLVTQKPGAVQTPATDSGAPPPTVEALRHDGGGDPPGPDEVPPPVKTDTTRCGDGLVTGNETCDISLAQDEPGACPKDCPPLMENPCAQRALNGSGCQLECVVLELVCQGGDRCCPGKCTQDNDPDCSPSCGDSIVQESRGETCEKVGENAPCITDPAACDDKEVCTTDELTGSKDHCNSACTHTKITTPKAGDGCCPEGANAGTDGDCKPRCGNNVREADEQCDGGAGCDANCKTISTPEQTRCLSTATSDCEKCACMNCTATELSCRMGDNARSNMLCTSVIECAKKNDCLGVPCYCGPGLCGLPYGPCKAEIEAAAGSTDWGMINQRFNDPMSALFKANAADQCRALQCRSTCRASPSAGSAR